MKDVMSFLKKNLGLEEEKPVEEEETIIVPEHSLYEIVMMKAKTIEDIEFAINQIIDEKNPVILDVGHLEIDTHNDFKLVGEKLKEFREEFGGQAILLCKNGKNVIIITPPEIKLVRK
jgi:SepF-like predicted cell division protein (DUF552 family)